MMDNTSIAGRDAAGDIIPSIGFTVAVCMCVAAGLAFAANMAGASAHRRTFAVEDTVNPNDASPASLGRLPGIGPARARAIVDYRRQFREANHGGPAFSRPQDLRKIAGIGPAIVTTIGPWLSFEARPAGEQAGVGGQP